MLEDMQDTGDAGGLLGGLGAEVAQLAVLALCSQLALDVIVELALDAECLRPERQDRRF